MDSTFIYVALAVLGLCFGSFAGAQVWRLRLHQLNTDKKAGEKVSAHELEKLKAISGKGLNDRSHCLSCGHVLQWYDLIPVISWLSLRGKCRYCNKTIGYTEPLAEVGLALFFVLSYAFWPLQLNALGIIRLVIWLSAGVSMTILLIYDQKWSILPDRVNYTLIALGIINAILVVIGSTNQIATTASILGAAAILSGLYWLIYYISGGRWIGYGDVKLGLGLALLLADWQLAFLALFLANLIGTLIVLPGMLLGQLKRTSRVAFGPMLILGAVIAGIWGSYLVNAYISLLVR